MTILSHLFSGIGQPDPEPQKPERKYRPLSYKTKSDAPHRLDREAFLTRKAELEAQYTLFPQARWENLNPDCIIPLVME